MADLIEIGIVVDSKPVNNLVAALGKASNAADLADKNFRSLEKALKQGIGSSADSLLKAFSRLERAGMSLSDVNKGLAQDAKMLAQANQAQVNSLLGVDRATKSARASAEAMKEAFRTQEIAIINTTKQTVVLAGTQSQAAMAAQKLAAAQRLSGKTTNKFGMISQQVGYQVGDFFVQIQGGTNKFVAFGQQATQLAGLLPGLAGAIVGVSISVGTLLLSSFDRMKKSVEDTDDLFKRVAENLNSMNSAASDAQQPFSDLAERFGESASKARLFLQVISAIQSAQFQKGFSEAADSLRSLFDVGEYASESIKTLETAGAAQQTILEDLLRQQRELLSKGDNVAALELGQKIQEARDIFQKSFGAMKVDVDQLAERLGVTQHVAAEFSATLARIGEAKTFEEKGQAAVDLAKFIRENVNITAQLTEAENAAVQKAVELALKFLEASNNADATAAAAGTIAPNIGAAADEAVRLALNLQASAVAAEQAAGTSIAIMNAQMEALNKGQNAYVAGAKVRVKLEKEAYVQAQVAGGLSVTEAKLAAEAMFKNREAVIGTTKAYDDLQASLKNSTKGLSKEQKDLLKAAEDLRKELEGPMVSAINGVSNAFGDFISNGLKDFKGFTKSILNSFKGMISQMISTAMSNKIMLSVGVGGSGLATQAAAGQLAGVGSAGFGGPMGGLMGTFGGGGAAGTGLLGGLGTAATGLGTGFMSSVYGGIGGMTGAVSGGLSVGGLAGISTAIGAIAAPLLAVAAVFSFFKKKTTELDNGLRITVTNMDTLVNTFQTVQTKKFWGLSKKTTTTESAASSEVADPFVKAIQDMQTQILKAADMFGIAESEFENFVYKFDLSLKGLTDEQKLQKVNEELLKMGDAFASLSGHFTSMNELLATAQQRYDLTTRLLVLQGDTEALLARQRELELAAVHDLNLELLQQIHTLEDVKIAEEAARKALEVYQQTLNETTQALEEANRAYESALGDLRNAMARQLSDAQSALDSAKSVFDTALSNRYESLQNNLGNTEQALVDAQQALAEAQRRAFEEGIQNRITAVNASFNSLVANLEASLDVAQRKAEASRQVFEVLDSALQGRRLASEAATFASRRSALSYVSSGGTDIDKLTSALGVLNEPSEQFFGTFQDYARDFALTTNAIKESRDLAGATMTADEKTVMLLEQQIEQSRASQEAQVEALEKMLVVQEDFLTVSQAMEQLLTAQENYDQAKEAHDELLLQYPQLQETFISVGDALANYLAAQATYEQIQAQHAELLAQYSMLNESVLTVTQAVTNLGSVIAAQTAATAAQAAAQTVLANAIAAANQVTTTEGVLGFAAGGVFGGGPRIVGENGPELEVTGPSRIYSNRDTAGMFRDPDLKDAVRSLKEEVSGLRSEQRQIQMDISKYTKRSYDIERKWDVEGLPATRT